MKIILLRDKGTHRAMHFTRRQLTLLGAGICMLALTGAFSAVQWLSADVIDADVIAEWRTKLDSQREELMTLNQKSQAQSLAVGRQLAQMRARLLRMEAIGAHMTEVADLNDGEFDFDSPPAQGGPVSGSAQALEWHELELELSQLSEQLRRRESELNILDEVLTNEDTHSASRVAGKPVTWGWMSSPFGQRVDPISGKPAWHSGVDFAGREGSDVIAVASGVVTYAGERSGYGKMVEISHADGLVTRYAHHKSIDVTVGDVVKKGERLGSMGSSGRSTGPHVHFEVLKNGVTVDPARYVARRS